MIGRYTMTLQGCSIAWACICLTLYQRYLPRARKGALGSFWRKHGLKIPEKSSFRGNLGFYVGNLLSVPCSIGAERRPCNKQASRGVGNVHRSSSRNRKPCANPRRMQSGSWRPRLVACGSSRLPRARPLQPSSCSRCLLSLRWVPAVGKFQALGPCGSEVRGFLIL